MFSSIKKIFKPKKYFLNLRAFDPKTLSGCRLDLDTLEVVSEHNIIVSTTTGDWINGETFIDRDTVSKAQITFQNDGLNTTWYPVTGIVEVLGCKDVELIVSHKGKTVHLTPEKVCEILKRKMRKNDFLGQEFSCKIKGGYLVYPGINDVP